MTANEFRAALARLRLRQTAFAETLGVHRVSVNRWANGKETIPRYAIAWLELQEQLVALQADSIVVA
jgi:DNA-binding transcriptional regulator YiaG